MAGLHFILMVVLYFLKPARDSLFLVETGPDQLPLVYILLAAVSLPVTLLVTNVLTRFPTRNVVGWVLSFLTLNLLLLRWLFEINHSLIYMFFYIWVGIFGILVISLYWLLANSIYNAAQSKRLFSLLTLSAILGSVIGSEASSLIVSYTNVITEDLLYICAGLLMACIVLIYFLPENRSNRNQKNDSESKIGDSNSEPSTIKTVFNSRYQLMIAGIITLTTIATTFTDYQFKVFSVGAYPQTESLTAFMGTFYAGISLASLGIQVLFSSGIIKKWGIAGAVLTRPAGMMFGAVLMAFEPVLASVIILNGIDNSTRYSIDKTGRELLFLPISQHIKERTKLFIDLFVDRFSRGLSGGFLLIFLVIADNPINLITYVLLFTLACWIYLGYRARIVYIDTFRTSLQRMLVDTNSFEMNLNEPAILNLIRESLSKGTDYQILHTLILLENVDIEPVADELKKLLKHSNAEIRLKALKQLQDVKDIHLNEEIENLLRDDDPEIRVETIYYLCLHSKDDPSQILKSFMADKDVRKQTAALGCTCKHGNENEKFSDPEMFDRILNNLPENEQDRIVVKAQIAEALGFIDNHSLTTRLLSELVRDKNRTIVTKALKSISKLKIDSLIPVLLQMLVNKEYTIEIREALGSFGSDYLTLFKNKFEDPDLNLTIRKQIPGIFYHLPNQKSVKHLEDMLEAEEPELRYHVIKTLNKMNRKYPETEFSKKRMRSFLQSESRNYFNLFAIRAIQPKNLPNSILLKALSEKMDHTLERIFRLLGLIYNQDDLYSSYLALNSNSGDKRSSAIEFIDNILESDDQEYVFPLIDNLSDDKMMDAGARLFNIETQTYDKALTILIEGSDRWLKICAIYSVSPVCPSGLQNRVEELTKSDDMLIRETAVLVQKRNQKKV